MALRASLTAILAVIVVGCSSWPKERGVISDQVRCDIAQLLSSEEVTTPDVEPVRLIVCPLDTQVRKGEPVRVIVVLQNVGPQRVHVQPLDLNLGLSAIVELPDGRQLTSKISHGYTIPPDTSIIIPVKGFVGRIVGLDCDVMDIPAPTTWQDCLPSIDFDQIGKYKVSIALEINCVHCDWDLLPRPPRLQAPPFTVEITSAREDR